MIDLSPQAADLLSEWRHAGAVPPHHGIRLDAAPAEEGSLEIRLAFAEAPMETDEVGERAGTRIFVARDVAGPLNEAVIDLYIDDDENPQLVLTMPAEE